MEIYRVYAEKKKGFDVEAVALLQDMKENLMLPSLTKLRIFVRYDIAGISQEVFDQAKGTILSEPQVDKLYEEEAELPGFHVFAVELLPGQFDQRADSAAQCIQILTSEEKPLVRAAKVYAVNNEVSLSDLERIKKYIINPVESREASLKKPQTLELKMPQPAMVETVEGFIDLDEAALKTFLMEQGFAFDLADIKFCQEYFKHTEKRNPTVTELRMIDTYWSDHCRHTTFSTELEQVVIEDQIIRTVNESYLNSREFVYDNPEKKPLCFMDIATMASREMKKKGMLPDLDESEEINACSIRVEAEINGKKEPWLVMFKNETHNHPTEIEPFGGAATCLGGAIRDPLSGRSYVYQAMRITGSGDPRATVAQTLKGKLPQRKISTTAAAGYSSYGNQIGLATGLVREVYDESYRAKRMEIGAVVGAVPADHVVREIPEPGDVVLLLGGRTGRDGIGGATGSSKSHTETSLESCGAEVQKGNAPEERKLQRLFRKQEVTKLIKRCNDFGAGGVSVAIGELADGLMVNLDQVPKKYAGLDGTELAISESQERMAVVVAKENMETFIAQAAKENIEATMVAEVTEEKRLRMSWQNTLIVDISREFLNSNGAKKTTNVYIGKNAADRLFESIPCKDRSYRERFTRLLSDLNVCSQKGLIERFDSTIGAGTVLMPFGGKYEWTPAEVMAAKLPVENGETKTATVMSYGFDPKLSAKSPFYGAVYAVLHSVAKIVAAGCELSKVYLTLQEYFKKLGEDPKRWGEPLGALLGAYLAQKELGIAAIGGKDSMSGSFHDLDVVPTLVSFAIAPVETSAVISNELKSTGSKVLLIQNKKNGLLPDFEHFKKISETLSRLIREGRIRAASAVPMGGVAEGLLKMSFGNKIGVDIVAQTDLFRADYGSYLIETDRNFEWADAVEIGYTNDSGRITVAGESISIDELIGVFAKPLDHIYPAVGKQEKQQIKIPYYYKKEVASSNIKVAKPKVVIPVFPGTNCEYDTARRFEMAGAETEILVFKNLHPSDVLESAKAMEKAIRSAQIVVIPGGFSGGDEPDGSGKFIATALRNEGVKEAIEELLSHRDGLMLGICNGFQALIKLGLVPEGKILEPTPESPTLTYNTIGRHVSTMVKIKVMSNLSPWLGSVKTGEVFTVPVSHGEGRFICGDAQIEELIAKGQVATAYVDSQGNPTDDPTFNPNGSRFGVEGITSADGRILGKMGHSERIGDQLYKNISGNFDMKLFESGVNYFK